ncbi:MAG TPA: hypothetical protein ENI23_12785 [bacterium]|nr:hypothetical protein [bacterium]
MDDSEPVFVESFSTLASIGKANYYLKLKGIPSNDENDSSCVEQTIFDIHTCLNKNELPETSDDCDFCKYREAVCNHNA